MITKKIVDRELDQVLRMWMPYDDGFLIFQPPSRMRLSRPSTHRRLRVIGDRPGLARQVGKAWGRRRPAAAPRERVCYGG